MSRRTIALQSTFTLLAVSCWISSAAGQPTGSFKAGFAERDITPEIGMEAPGGYGKSYHESIHDPCKVRAAVFDDGRSRVAIVGIDALGIRRDTVQKVRQAVQARTGIPAESILIGASHSHSSGPLVWTMRGEFDHASPLVQRLAYEESTIADPKYLARVEQALIDAICEADDRRVGSRAGVGKGVEGTVAFNRRFLMRDGRAVTHPGLGNPEIVEPAGPVDPEVGVIGAWDAKDPDRLLGCVVNFACHATTSPAGISANYIYYLEKAIQGYYGKECVVVFLAGASGDITQVDNRSAYEYPERRTLGADRRRQGRGRGVEGPARRWSRARSRRSRPGPGSGRSRATIPVARAGEGGPRDRPGGPQESSTRRPGRSPRRPSCSTPC